MGLSGSGKSTLVRHVNRLLTPTAGQIKVSGVDIMSLDEQDLLKVRNEKIAMVFQSFRPIAPSFCAGQRGDATGNSGALPKCPLENC